MSRKLGPSPRRSPTLLLAALVLLGAAGCRSYLSYVPLEPQSPGWADDEKNQPGGVVWAAEGVTVRAYAAPPFGAGFGGTGNSEVTPGVVEMEVVVTNDGRGPLVVGVALGDLDNGTKVEKIEALRGRNAFVVVGYDELDRIEWSAGLPQWSREGDPREVAFRVRLVDWGKPANEVALPIRMRIIRDETEFECPARFLAVGSARELHWYTVPMDGFVYVGEVCTFVVSVPMAMLGMGPIYWP